MGFLFTSESVSEGHPDKVADQISDALLDEFLRYDPKARVACETLVTTGLVLCAGEVNTKCWVDIQKVVRETIRKIGYTKAEYKFDADSCGVITTIHEQSPDITQGVDKSNGDKDQGAGDQGMMFGMATNEMQNYMPIPIELAHLLVQYLAKIRKETNDMPYLRPDTKSQVTIEYDDHGKPVSIDAILISSQHDEFIRPEDTPDGLQSTADKMMQNKIREDILTILIPKVLQGGDVPESVKKLFSKPYKLLVNPTGKFVIGGPHGDTGLTGRKIIVDTYGGKGYHGGGAFSGKDASKVDRSGAYAARHIAKNMVAAGIADEVHVQVSYAIGEAEPLSFYVNTMKTARVKNNKGEILTDKEIADKVKVLFDMRPSAIIKRFGLTNPVFLPTATYGHFGRDMKPNKRLVEVYYQNDPGIIRKMENGKEKFYKEVEFFAWEKLDYIDRLKETFGI